MDKKLIELAFTNLPSEIEKAEINLEAHKAYSFAIKDYKFININYSYSEEYFVRTSGKKEGYYYTQDGSEEPYQMFIKAYQNSEVASKESATFYNQEHYYQKNNSVFYSLSELKQKAMNLYKCLVSQIVEGELSVELIARKTQMMTMNNLGLNVDYDFPVYILIAYLNGKDGIYPINVRNDLVLDNLEQDLSDFANCMNQRYQFQKQPLEHFISGQYRVLLDQNFVYVILCTAWQLFSGKKYVEKATCYADKLNQQIGSDLLSFYDDNENGFKFAYDCEGSKGFKSMIVDKGKFVSPLLNNESSNYLGLENNACAGRKPLLFGNIATDIQITPRNFLMKKGVTSFDEMLEKLNDGILITEHFDIFHSLDITSGEFAIPCFGVAIKGGKPTSNLRALVLTGNIKEVFNNIEAVSNRQTIRPMHYLNNYGIGACDLLVSKMMVSGE